MRLFLEIDLFIQMLEHKNKTFKFHFIYICSTLH